MQHAAVQSELPELLKLDRNDGTSASASAVSSSSRDAPTSAIARQPASRGPTDSGAWLRRSLPPATPPWPQPSLPPPPRPEPPPGADEERPRPPSSAPENSPQVIRCRHRYS